MLHSLLLMLAKVNAGIVSAVELKAYFTFLSLKIDGIEDCTMGMSVYVYSIHVLKVFGP